MEAEVQLLVMVSLSIGGLNEKLIVHPLEPDSYVTTPAGKALGRIHRRLSIHLTSLLFSQYFRPFARRFPIRCGYSPECPDQLLTFL